MAEDINTRFANASLRHMLMLQRLEQGAVNKLIPPLKEARKEILAIINSASDSIETGTDAINALSPEQQFRVRQLSTQIDRILLSAGLVLTRDLTDELRDLADSEGRLITEILNRQIPPSAGLTLEFNRIPLDQIERMVNTPLGGEIYGERLTKNLGEASGRVRASLVNSLVQGNTIKQAASQVRSILGDVTIRRAEMIVRTEFARVASQANVAAMRQNEKFLDGFMWIATLDDRTCPICMDLHGQKLKVDTNQIPPEHPLCRCTLVPVLKKASQLGVDLPPELESLFTGEMPDIPLDFNEFLAGQTPEFRVQSLGKARAALFDQGVKVGDMVADGRVLTLDEIRGIAA